MPRDEATGHRVVFPIRHRGNRALASHRAASVRAAVRRMFPDDERYFKAFNLVRLGDIAASFQGRRVTGVLLIHRSGRDVFDVSGKTFRRLYGPVKGTFLYWRYFIAHKLTRAGNFYLASIWVGKRARNSGTGSKLLRAATSQLGGKWTVLARNEHAERFFARHGFQRRRGLHARILSRVTGRIPMEWDGGAVKKLKKRRWRPSGAPNRKQIGT